MDSTARVCRASLTGVALAVAAVLTAGCTASTSGSGGSVAASAGGTTSTTPSSSATGGTTAPASGAAAGSSSGTGSSGTGASGAASCSTNELKASIGGSQGAAGSVYTVIDFTNTGSTTCTMYGYPGVSLDNSGGQIGAAATRDPSRGPATVTLAPGAEANATVRVAEAGNYPSSSCSPDSASFLKIYPPNQTVALDVPYQGTGCRQSSVKLLSVGAVASGAGSAG